MPITPEDAARDNDKVIDKEVKSIGRIIDDLLRDLYHSSVDVVYINKESIPINWPESQERLIRLYTHAGWTIETEGSDSWEFRKNKVRPD